VKYFKIPESYLDQKLELNRITQLKLIEQGRGMIICSMDVKKSGWRDVLRRDNLIVGGGCYNLDCLKQNILIDVARKRTFNLATHLKLLARCRIFGI
jgi:hypothetical protein